MYPLSPRRQVPPEIQRPDYADTGNHDNKQVERIKAIDRKKNCKGIPKSEFMAKRSEIRVLNADEIEGIKKACQVKNRNRNREHRA